MLKNNIQIENLSKKYNIPVEDIILIAINLCGVNDNIQDDRIRFKFKLKTCPELFYLAVCVNTDDSPFYIKNNNLFFHNYSIGTIMEREKDTCDSTYFRRNKTALTINSNSRSKCSGCKFCGTYKQGAEDTNDLKTEKKITQYINSFLTQNKFNDLSNIVDVGICTGCFNSEEETLEHILMVRKVFKNFRFHKELKYLGSQITSEKSLKILQKQAQPFSLYFTLECFTRRKELLRHHKADITIVKAKKILKSAKEKGFNTNILYILGLDPFKVVIKEFQSFLPYITRFPIINLLQNYLPGHEVLRINEAKDIEYYLKVRKELERIFTLSNLRPRPWEDYRNLWYLSFNNQKIDDIRI